MTGMTTARDLTKLSTRQLKDEAEAVQTAQIIDGDTLRAIDMELRRRKAQGASKREQ